ncbi:MAG TPA: hypothetical protein PLR99_17955 [Polyangiaceae bacterium]|nr:hypothetical protein [Polyangiaceae bacterium]
MLLDDGSVACRGGFAAGGETQVVGVEDNGTIAGLTGKKATQIAAGTGHACARIEDGSVVCWGTNDFAELGLSGTVASPGLAVSVAPGVSSLPAKVAQVGAGEHFSCARTDGGEVYCWGAMTHADHASSPARVAGLPPVIDMGVAEHNVCARAYDDALWCWGDDLSGQSGVHPTVDSVPPTKLEGVNGVVTELAPSSLAYYARTLDGKVWAWGNTGSKTSFPHVIGR